MVQQPVITIITPVFNGEKYIRNCIDNFLAQGCAQAEHLIMDGASKDGTVAILEEYASRHPNVRFISEKDSGQSNAMNKGIQAAKGKIISFLNVDDTYEPRVLNRVVEVFKKLPEPSFVCANLNIWNADGSFRHLNKPSKVTPVNILSDLEEWPYNPSAYFYHKTIHNKVGNYAEDEHFAMDYDFIIRAVLEVPFTYVDEIWGNFFMVEDSKTLSEQQKGAEQISNRSKQIREKYLKKVPLSIWFGVKYKWYSWAVSIHWKKYKKKLRLA